MGVWATLAGAQCATDAVEVGPWCVDIKEASVFGNAAGSGTQFGVAADDYPATCLDNGNGCSTIFALSQSGVMPSRFITWFQAQQACMNVGKELLPNAIWQGAAADTPDNAVDCNIGAGGTMLNTGARAGCVSRWGAMDMVGNAEEIVADWIQGNGPAKAGDAGPDFGNDGVFGINVTGRGAASDPFSPALFRGGFFGLADVAGVFNLDASLGLERNFQETGFRCGLFQ